MKLSELTTERAADVLCELTPYIANITGDKFLLDELATKFDSKGKSVAELYTFAAHKYATLVPVLLKEHRNDVFGVLAVLNECSADEIAKQTVMETMNHVRDRFPDKTVIACLKSVGQEAEAA